MKPINVKKIIIYILFVIIIFSISLLFLPYELFLVSTIVVLFALRGVEKELGGLSFRNIKSFHTQPTKTKV